MPVSSVAGGSHGLAQVQQLLQRRQDGAGRAEAHAPASPATGRSFMPPPALPLSGTDASTDARETSRPDGAAARLANDLMAFLVGQQSASGNGTAFAADLPAGQATDPSTRFVNQVVDALRTYAAQTNRPG